MQNIFQILARDRLRDVVDNFASEINLDNSSFNFFLYDSKKIIEKIDDSGKITCQYQLLLA